MNEADNQITLVNPIAIKLSAIEELSEHIPPFTYELWGKVACDCGEEFNVYGNIIHSRPDEHQKYADVLAAHLKKEDAAGKPHQRIYECDPLFLDRIIKIPE
jgi:hypothetical protein